ncbi:MULTISPECIES: ATP-dependent protease ATPase subunit HslU [Nosocomiicoccus]|uniref:ATP-dependent protease ATPase subunit HslU n=1 Tax=Nosocomiicoccus TaxID=489909 RepID=UPI0008A231ED|nr:MULTISPECIES: ATP-dependent protease ATPase subunit HslU [Nosocomiicoccus]MDK6863045.1 ATP-dependent protease ATPase subunit HslU [Nosocomiicoccus ampullae]OFL49808.1 ATP-dependent protease ATP-binding subunit HslU [Nosocomiicoccus sp. HMSC067E10]OFS62316.1 HslU--HslV peptidase ATPase subunit [Nosocomiicoccus sp. HMSC09A07]
MLASLSPREIVSKLDENIVGQYEAKRKVAIAMRNRYRRMKLSDELKHEVIPKNILMIGPTGVGKTEVARRMAKITGAPFTKVEATKYTEVGYVGRDVESMVRDLVETSVKMVKEELFKGVREEATKLANERLIKLLAPGRFKEPTFNNPFEMLSNMGKTEEPVEEVDDTVREKRRNIRQDLEDGRLEERVVEIEVEEKQMSMMMPGMDNGMGDMLQNMMPKKKRKKRLPVKHAREHLIREESEGLIDTDLVYDRAIELAETLGIIFIDEMDKIAMGSNSQAGVSREGVQRDILPIVEGSVVETKYGPVNTEHILFIGAGAFHVAKPSDLIPELQGRFPIRVELDKLKAEDFKRILTEPKHSLLKQYEALLETEGVTVSYTDEAIEALANIAYDVNSTTDDIGARRLHTIMETLLEELLFEADNMHGAHVEITEKYVNDKLDTIKSSKNLSQFIL